MSCEWLENYSELKKYHDRAHHILKNACEDDINENLEVALEKYKTGLGLLILGLNAALSCPEIVYKACRDATKMVNHLTRAKPVIEKRMEHITRILEERRFRETSPTLFSELVRVLREIQNASEDNSTRELVFCCENVKFYTIQQDGTVTLTLDNTLLEIWKYTKSPAEEPNEGIFFMQITKTSEPVLALAAVNESNGAEGVAEEDKAESNGSSSNEEKDDSKSLAEIVWTYPLLPGVSPCFRTRFGAIIMPDLRAPPSAGATVGMQVEGPPDEVLMEILDEILKCVYRQQDEDTAEQTPRRQSRSVAVSEKITKGAYYFSQGLIRGSQKTGEFITYSTPYIISRMEKAPITVAPVSTGVRTGVEVAKTVTGTAASVTGFMAQKLGTATMALGRFIAPHIQKQGSRILSHSLGMSQEVATEKMADALTVAAGAVEAFGTVYTGLEESASILGRSLSTNSVKVIEHKYGPTAGNLASSTFETAGNVFALSHNVRLMTPKGIAKKAAKSTGRALVEDFHPQSGPSRDVTGTDNNGKM
ncbi:protein spartin [Lutzomyia longipalpis]|uniref:protein spartin n=1 Tax=Lutzomyia longipalpis TaxID=7200 RepID=UPI0024841910|nr:protein spartin [Lutzomyia longipalpis]XP_055695525.1 protein spartin [Lutzomyia longipalpis]